MLLFVMAVALHHGINSNGNGDRHETKEQGAMSKGRNEEYHHAEAQRTRRKNKNLFFLFPLRALRLCAFAPLRGK